MQIFLSAFSFSFCKVTIILLRFLNCTTRCTYRNFIRLGTEVSCIGLDILIIIVIIVIIIIVVVVVTTTTTTIYLLGSNELQRTKTTQNVQVPLTPKAFFA